MPSSGKTSRRARTGAVVIFAVSVVALLLLAERVRENGFEFARFLASFTRLDWGWITAAVVFVLMAYVGRAVRWAVMIKPMQPDPRFRELLSATIMGFTAVTLFGRAGELVRPYLIASKLGLTFSSQIAAWFLERVYDLLVVLMILGFALAQVQLSAVKLGPRLDGFLKVGGYVVIVASLSCLALLFLIHRYSDWMRRRLTGLVRFLPESRRETAGGALSAFLEGMGSTRSGSFVALLIFYSAAEWALVTGCFLCVFKAMPETAGLSLRDTMIFMGFVSFGSVVQIPGIGGGTQVTAVVMLTELFGMPLEVAGSVAVLIWAVSFLSIVPPGLVLALYEGVNWNKLRKNLTEETPAAL